MAKIIALIGIDGSGKSTQAELLYHALKKRGFKVRVIYAGNTGVKLGRKFSFYLSLPIDVIVHRLLGLRDKSALLKYRALLKLEDLLLFLNYIVLVLPKILLYKRTCNFLITDRYVYDYIISMLIQKRSRTFMKILLQIVPRPTLTILLDTDPFIAHQRKGGENPVNELLFLRPLYYRFVVSVGGIIVDASGSKAETINGIWKAVRSCISQEQGNITRKG